MVFLHQEALRNWWGRDSATNPRENHSLNFLRSKNLPTLVFQGGERLWPEAAGFGLGMLREFLLIPNRFRCSASPVPCQDFGGILHSKEFCVKAWFKTCTFAKAVWNLLKNSDQFSLCQNQTGDFGVGGCAYAAFSETPRLQLIPSPIN